MKWQSVAVNCDSMTGTMGKEGGSEKSQYTVYIPNYPK
jgi:hypothetical protein